MVGKWLRVRGDLAAPGEPALFVSKLGTRISHRSVQKRMAEWGQKQSVASHISHINCVTHLPRTCWSRATTYVRCKSF